MADVTKFATLGTLRAAQRATLTVRALWGMARPLIMLSVVQVYLAATLIARARGVSLDWVAFGWGGLALLLVALSIHYTNEYADFETDALTRPTPYSGGSGVLPGGTVDRRLALQAAWVTLITGGALAVAAWICGILSGAALGLLALGAIGGWQYSLRPLKMAWRGWGELDNAVLGGLTLSQYGYVVHSGDVDAAVLVAWLPFTGLTFLNLLATTWADRTADGQVGKRTLATRWPVARLRRVYLGVALLSFSLLIALRGAVLPDGVVLASLLAIPFVIWGTLRYTRTDAPHASVNTMVVFLAAQMIGWWLSA